MEGHRGFLTGVQRAQSLMGREPNARGDGIWGSKKIGQEDPEGKGIAERER